VCQTHQVTTIIMGNHIGHPLLGSTWPSKIKSKANHTHYRTIQDEWCEHRKQLFTIVLWYSCPIANHEVHVTKKKGYDDSKMEIPDNLNTNATRSIGNSK
jgi:hypothetical protein